jgi:hypothetical protein
MQVDAKHGCLWICECGYANRAWDDPCQACHRARHPEDMQE